MKAAPREPTWCTFAGYSPRECVCEFTLASDAIGSHWTVRVRGNRPELLPYLGQKIPVMVGMPGRIRSGLAYIATIVADSDPDGTGWPLAARLVGASPLIDLPPEEPRPMTERTIDLTDPDRKLTDRETSDVTHRAGFPRSEIGFKRGRKVVGIVTGWASDLADARCGVPVDLPPGPHPNRGTLRWYRHYIAHLDDCADLLNPGWRDVAANAGGPELWCEAAFGSVSRHGCSAPPPSWPEKVETHVVGYWTFPLPPSQV